MISFIVRRQSNEEYEQLLKIHSWCEKQFGKSDYYNNWSVSYAYSNTDDYVRFKFYNEVMATWFLLKFNDYIFEDKEEIWS